MEKKSRLRKKAWSEEDPMPEGLSDELYHGTSLGSFYGIMVNGGFNVTQRYKNVNEIYFTSKLEIATEYAIDLAGVGEFFNGFNDVAVVMKVKIPDMDNMDHDYNIPIDRYVYFGDINNSDVIAAIFINVVGNNKYDNYFEFNKEIPTDKAFKIVEKFKIDYDK